MPTAGRAPFTWAILGAGQVSRKFVQGLSSGPHPMQAVVVASRTFEHADRLAQEVGATAVREYEHALAHPGVDAVYVATPPSEHERHALMAISAGKPVLVEKPFAMDHGAATRIATAARRDGVFCMEAMWTRFLPLIELVKQRIDAGAIGEVREFDGAFLSATRPGPQSSIYDLERGGGALMHRGVYPLSLARHLLGPISDVQAMARIGETSVDEDCALMIRHSSGAISTIRASLRVGGPSEATIHGESGTITLFPPIYRPSAARIERTVDRVPATGKPRGLLGSAKEKHWALGLQQRVGRPLDIVRGLRGDLRAYYSGNGYHHEAAALMTEVRAGNFESPIMPLAQSVEIMRVIDDAKSCWRMAVEK